MVDIIGEIIIMFVFNYHGAGIRWLISRVWGSKKTFKEFVSGDIYTNGLIGLLTFALVLGVMYHI